MAGLDDLTRAAHDARRSRRGACEPLPPCYTGAMAWMFGVLAVLSWVGSALAGLRWKREIFAQCYFLSV